MTDTSRHPVRLLHVALVALVTASWLVGVLGAFTVGVLALPVALVCSLLLALGVVRGRVTRTAAAGVPAGLSVLPGWFAYLAAGHPGLSDVAVSDDGLPSPWWSGAVAASLVTASLLVLGAARPLRTTQRTEG